MLWFQASAAMLTTSELFWDITQRRMVIIYRRFGITYRSYLEGFFLDFLTLEDGTDMLYRNVGKELPLDAA
jgi:hypothetical protein